MWGWGCPRGGGEGWGAHRGEGVCGMLSALCGGEDAVERGCGDVGEVGVWGCGSGHWRWVGAARVEASGLWSGFGILPLNFGGDATCQFSTMTPVVWGRAVAGIGVDTGKPLGSRCIGPGERR